jgi:hypothetical protein
MVAAGTPLSQRLKLRIWIFSRSQHHSSSAAAWAEHLARMDERVAAEANEVPADDRVAAIEQDACRLAKSEPARGFYSVFRATSL